MANIKNFGIKGVASDVQLGKSGGFVVYDSSNNKFQFKDNGSSLEDVEFATVQAGTWSGTEIAVTKGGTGLTSIAKGSVLVANSANTLSALDGGGSNDGILTYTASSDTLALATAVDGGTFT